MNGFAASSSQRAKVREIAACAWCADPSVDPAHLIPRSLITEGQDEPLAVIPLCRHHHDQFDRGELDILPALEPRYRKELAFAVERVGLAAVMRRVTVAVPKTRKAANPED